MSTDSSPAERAVELHRNRIASAQRYELVGQIAGPVTHEINNALGVIVMYADLLRTQFDDGTETREDLDEIFEAAQRAAWFSKWLNSYSSRDANPRQVSVCLTTVLEGLRKIATKYAAARGLEIEFRLAPSPAVTAPQAEVEDLVLALLADMAWSVEEGEVVVEVRETDSGVELSLVGTGRLSGVGELGEFTFLAPGPGDAGTGASTATLTERAARLGGLIEHEQGPGTLRYRLELPTGGPG